MDGKGSVEVITSPQNIKIKEARRLRESRDRRSQKLFLVEGFREIQRAIQESFAVEKFFYCEELLNLDSRKLIREGDLRTRLFSVSKACFEKLVVREKSDGIVAVFKEKDKQNLSVFKKSKPLSLLILSGVEKPGNVGAMIRSADGAGFDGLLITGQGESYDLYNPHLIRSSLGCVFSLPIWVGEEKEASDFLFENSLTVYGAHLSENSKAYWDANFVKGFGLVMGSEDKGMSDYWRQKCSSFVSLPMMGIADSLNVSTACAVLLYEARRQRATLP